MFIAVTTFKKLQKTTRKGAWTQSRDNKYTAAAIKIDV